jgi:hypothetical protein
MNVAKINKHLLLILGKNSCDNSSGQDYSEDGQRQKWESAIVHKLLSFH